jgi:hypothetical protein
MAARTWMEQVRTVIRRRRVSETQSRSELLVRFSKVDPMSSTTFGPVFRVGAFGHSGETLDTRAEGTGGALRPRPCPKIRLAPPARYRLSCPPHHSYSHLYPVELHSFRITVFSQRAHYEIRRQGLATEVVAPCRQ